MPTPSNEELERAFSNRLRDLPNEKIVAVRERSKLLFGNQDRFEVAVAVAHSQLGRVNATDLHRVLDLAVNRIRAQLLALEAIGRLERLPDENGKRMFARVD